MSALSCMRKKPFSSEIEAQSAIYRMRARNQDTELLESYECGTCKQWHLRHKPRVPTSPVTAYRTWMD